MTGLLLGGEKLGPRDSGTQGGCYVQPEAEMGGTGVQAEECRFHSSSLQKLGGRQRTDSPSEVPEGPYADCTSILGFWPPEL